MIANLRQAAPNCRILATSREPLVARDECLERLPPLALPRSGATLASEILQAPAVRLFVELATAHDSSFALHDEDVDAIHQVCQRLDGVPLEIEIAAARVGSFGIQPLLNMLNGEFRLQMASRRTAAKRHRSIGAVLDWSYVGLLPCEQAVLRVASTFTGPFTLNAVSALIKGEPLLNGQDPQRIVERLVAKSLLLAEPGDDARYRLLASTRLYAHNKLKQTGGAQQAVTRHAAYALAIVRKAASHQGEFPDAWQAILGAESDSVRSALAHACSAQSEQSPSLELKLMTLGLTSKRRSKVMALDTAALYQLA
jgi:predicted ATPase